VSTHVLSKTNAGSKVNTRNPESSTLGSTVKVVRIAKW
jgi:hypothetical protein